MLMQQIAIETMKKAMDTQARAILSALQSDGVSRLQSSPPANVDVPSLTGLGRYLDLKA